MSKEIQSAEIYCFVSNLQDAQIAVMLYDPHLATYRHFRTYHPEGAKFIYVELKDERYKDEVIRYLDRLHECRLNHQNDDERAIEYLADHEGCQKWLYLYGPDYDYIASDEEEIFVDWGGDDWAA